MITVYSDDHRLHPMPVHVDEEPEDERGEAERRPDGDHPLERLPAVHQGQRDGGQEGHQDRDDEEPHAPPPAAICSGSSVPWSRYTQ